MIPPDYFPVRSLRKRLPELVGHASAANMNMLRIWGGGVYGDESLYDLCEVHGILVWQDFMSACAMVPGRPRIGRQNFLAEAEPSPSGGCATERPWPCGVATTSRSMLGALGAGRMLTDCTGRIPLTSAHAYAAVFEHALPRLVEALNGGFYWPSSPHCRGPMSLR